MNGSGGKILNQKQMILLALIRNSWTKRMDIGLSNITNIGTIPLGETL